MAKTTGRLT